MIDGSFVGSIGRASSEGNKLGERSVERSAACRRGVLRADVPRASPVGTSRPEAEARQRRWVGVNAAMYSRTTSDSLS